MSQDDGERQMRRTVGPSGDRTGKLQTEKTTGSEVSCTDLPLVIEDESTQRDAEVMDCENQMTSDMRSGQSVEGPEHADLLPESPRSPTRRQGNIYERYQYRPGFNRDTRGREAAFFRERQSINKESIKEKLLKLGSLNVKNIETNEVYLRELLKECDILAIQEHWLFNFQLSNIGKTFVTHQAFSKAVDEDNPLPPNQKPRGYGGVALLFRKVWNLE